jgi:hypothetical protein
VQVGVFSNHTNAEELMQKLHEAGIPAQIESRVQVGPFASPYQDLVTWGYSMPQHGDDAEYDYAADIRTLLGGG